MKSSTRCDRILLYVSSPDVDPLMALPCWLNRMTTGKAAYYNFFQVMKNCCYKYQWWLAMLIQRALHTKCWNVCVHWVEKIFSLRLQFFFENIINAIKRCGCSSCIYFYIREDDDDMDDKILKDEDEGELSQSSVPEVSAEHNPVVTSSEEMGKSTVTAPFLLLTQEQNYFHIVMQGLFSLNPGFTLNLVSSVVSCCFTIYFCPYQIVSSWDSVHCLYSLLFEAFCSTRLLVFICVHFVWSPNQEFSKVSHLQALCCYIYIFLRSEG